MRLQYDIAITGQAAVKAALAGIERRFVEHNKRMARQAGVTPGKTGQAKSGDSQVLRAQRMQSGVDRFLHKQRLQQIKAEERARLASERAVAREARESQRRQERLFTNRARNRLRRMRVNRREAAAAERAHERFVSGTVGRGASSLGHTARYIGGTAAGALALGGGALVGSALREATSVDQGIRRLIINARGPGETSKYTPEELGGKVRATSMVSGIDQGAIVEGMTEFVGRTGNLDAAVDNMQVFATVAQATGAHMADVSAPGASIPRAAIATCACMASRVQRRRRATPVRSYRPLAEIALQVHGTQSFTWYSSNSPCPGKLHSV